jgi:hypothetical protein
VFGWRFCLQHIYVRKQRSPELLALSPEIGADGQTTSSARSRFAGIFRAIVAFAPR